MRSAQALIVFYFIFSSLVYIITFMSNAIVSNVFGSFVLFCFFWLLIFVFIFYINVRHLEFVGMENFCILKNKTETETANECNEHIWTKMKEKTHVRNIYRLIDRSIKRSIDRLM